MTMSPVNLSKEHPDLPDSYTVTVDHINGKSEVIEVASHVVVDKIIIYKYLSHAVNAAKELVLDGMGKNIGEERLGRSDDEYRIALINSFGNIAAWEPHSVPFIEFRLTDNTYKTVATANASFHYDKNWTKIVRIKKEMLQKTNDNKKLDG